MTGPGETSEDRPAERLEATVRGRVQGVGYRYFVLRIAARQRLTGWVANEPDGSVRCVIEGPPDELDRIEVGLREGPPGAVVHAVQAVRMPATGRFDRFEVRSAGHSGD
jgi:acylphosphatase